MLEEIGKVKLDHSKYPGEDLYCDGAVEDELLDIARNLSPVEYAGVIEERKNWPILYHLSPLRENIVEWIPMKKSDKVLEVGSGCGAITGVLSRKAASVTCVELSRKRSLINAYRHSECDNVTIHVGNFKDIEPDLPKDFDYICLIGVFEYGQSYIGGDKPYHDFLNILLPHLKEDGRIIIAIENKYGMKYFAGCREDHLGTYFSGIEDYADGGGVRTFGRRGLEKIFRSCKIPEYHFYYPYPDYKFMTTLYSDAYLPGKGELSNNMRNFDRDRMALFSEKNAFDGVVEEGLFSLFANSYLAVIGKGFDIKYVKYSNDRAPEFAIRTEIGRDDKGYVSVRKYPLGEASKEHVRGMALAYENLTDKYRGGELEINQCTLVENEDELYAQFEFVQGVPLSELMDKCLEQDDLEGFHRYFKQYVEKIGYNSDYPVADFDLIFANILVHKDTWTLIDYEWTFGKPISTKELAFRAVYCYLLEDEKRNRLNLDRILEELEITEEDAESFREQERGFQKFVTGNRLAMAEMRERIGNPVVVPQKWVGRYQDAEKVNRIQIYEDTGNGFSEKNSFFLEEEQIEKGRFRLVVEEGRRALRIDPCSDCCIVMLGEVSWNDESLLSKSKYIATNGFRVGDGVYAFDTRDPGITLQLSRLAQKRENILKVSMQVTRVPEETIKHMQRKGRFQ
ncbi:MAG: class I SAM-dependent methyltransferase [Lachnospiraceae bacterium]|nr:class I SAM-dependent methyltransferase [Butyrivibrio sp.]MCM1343540.1 class I SAM-dependent methyltransferase [Muribaculaceae bacterium]MCM1410597.1 class I SAM-dependent methyltransferase [Lachnospiraceae bacterium]